MPMPVCKNLTTSFSDIDDLINQEDYLGDASDGDWIYNGYIDKFDDSLLLAMPNQSSGTVLSSTHYVWYGKISAHLKTSHLQGVITAFILFSNAQDEIDYEFIGSELDLVESNYYYQAVLNYTNVKNTTVSNTYENFHTYEIDWTPEELTWSIDGNAFRTLKKADTYNESTESYHYPQTPSRVQISLWPGGDSKNKIGTVAWAGGAIDWNSDDIKDNGYYYMLLKNISVECYMPPSSIHIEGDQSYVFNNSKSFDQDDIIITDEDTVLGSKKATGLDPDEGKESSSASSSSSSSTDQSTKTKSSSSGKSTGSSENTTKKDGGDKGGSSSTSAATGFVQFGESTSASGGKDASSSNGGIMSLPENSIISIVVSFLMFFTAL